MNAAGYPVATMVNAKGMVDEQHPNYIGTYWGQVSNIDAVQICTAPRFRKRVVHISNVHIAYTLHTFHNYVLQIDSNAKSMSAQVSTAYAAETVESADAYLVAGEPQIAIHDDR